MAPSVRGTTRPSKRSAKEDRERIKRELERSKRDMERARKHHARLTRRLRSIRYGHRLSSAEEVQIVQTGVPVELVVEIQKELGLTQEGLSKTLGIPKRTLLNHMKKTHLDIDESDRVIRLKRVLEIATDVFEGDKESTVSWLKTSNRALGGSAPIDLISTGVGARAVEEVLGRMEHSLYS